MSDKSRTVQSTQEQPLSRKRARKKRGVIYLAIAVVCFIASLIFASLGGGGAIGSFLVVATLILFVGGVIYIIGGFVGKE